MGKRKGEKKTQSADQKMRPWRLFPANESNNMHFSQMVMNINHCFCQKSVTQPLFHISHMIGQTTVTHKPEMWHWLISPLIIHTVWIFEMCCKIYCKDWTLAEAWKEPMPFVMMFMGDEKEQLIFSSINAAAQWKSMTSNRCCSHYAFLNDSIIRRLPAMYIMELI